MTLILTVILSSALWIVLLSLGIKPFDALMVPVLLIALAASARVFAPFLAGGRDEDERGEGYTPR